VKLKVCRLLAQLPFTFVDVSFRAIIYKENKLYNRIQIGRNMLKMYKGFDEIRHVHEVSGLDLSGMGLDKIPAEVYQMKNLIDLNLRQNNISSVGPELGKLNHLETLNLSFNRISVIEHPLPRSVTSLYLNSNDFMRFDCSKLIQLERIENLDLGFNPIRKFSADIDSLKVHGLLNLSNLPLSSMPRLSGSIVSVRRLFFSGMKDCAFPDWIFEMKKLSGLRLADIGMTRLSAQIGKLQNLTDLNISGNRLSFLPQEILALKKLQSLDLSGNRIRILPDLKKLPCLTHIDMSENELQKFPGFLLDNDQIREWEIIGNPFVYKVNCN